MAAKYVATFTLSSQVTEDSYKIFSHHLECSPETTIAEIIKWRDGLGRNITGISLTISVLDRLEPERSSHGT